MRPCGCWTRWCLRRQRVSDLNFPLPTATSFTYALPSFAVVIERELRLDSPQQQNAPSGAVRPRSSCALSLSRLTALPPRQKATIQSHTQSFETGFPPFLFSAFSLRFPLRCVLTTCPSAATAFALTAKAPSATPASTRSPDQRALSRQEIIFSNFNFTSLD
ncbi:hypothetical protein B0J12DRAFT_323720 [Macrophomina phaseolina]|uniref:Uncharacterized protein n=1 Tax=Macrophomina phaseolina TaxID=35725 RepID=A0ABQ8FYF1_9PEZI|nr:hypothetical protein B0J12DRAFT_323720 [Macrophomina phaseolina]